MILILLYYMPEIIDRGASFLISLLGFDIIERESLSADEPTGFDLSLDRGASFLIGLLGFDKIERESLSADEPTGFDLSLASRFLSQVFMS